MLAAEVAFLGWQKMETPSENCDDEVPGLRPRIMAHYLRHGHARRSEQDPKAEFAGCVIVPEERFYPATGKVESGIAKWACQKPECCHRW